MVALLGSPLDFLTCQRARKEADRDVTDREQNGKEQSFLCLIGVPGTVC